MAEQKNGGGRRGKRYSGKRNSRTMRVSAVFWIIFFTAVIGLFFYYSPEIKKNFSILSQSLNLPANTSPEAAPREKPEEPGGQPLPQTPAAKLAPPPAAPPGEKPPETPVEKPAVKPAPENPPAVVNPPKPPRPPAAPPPARPAEKPPAPKPAATRDRSIYFTHVDNDGTVSRVKVSRNLASSDSPMLDSLNALLAGPAAEEKRRDIRSFIPPNTRILSLIVRGNTAYISFNENFLTQQTYGVEGYAAQLKQIVWTATEFSNVKDVQILIEGQRVDFLGEGIWIGSPIGRDSL